MSNPFKFGWMERIILSMTLVLLISLVALALIVGLSATDATMTAEDEAVFEYAFTSLMIIAVAGLLGRPAVSYAVRGAKRTWRYVIQ